MENKLDYSRYVYLDSTSKTGLRWAYKGGRGISKHYIGDVAGTPQQTQAFRVCLDGKLYKVHRIVYEMYYGVPIEPHLVVDHINGNPFDNEIDNLRVVSRKINSRNMSLNKNNKTGIVGVCITTSKSGHTYARAQWRDLEGKHKSKSFSILKFGMELAIAMAVEKRDEAIVDLNRSGGGYTVDHGVRQLIPGNVYIKESV